MLQMAYAAPGYDLAGTGQLEVSQDLRTAILMSILTRAGDGADGWWGAEYMREPVVFGSRVHEILAGVRSATTPRMIEQEIDRSLAWMLDYKIASTVSSEVVGLTDDALHVIIAIESHANPQYAGSWEITLEL